VSELREIQQGLWRWTARHPGWVANATPESPADWPREVGSVLCDAPDATVLIDPLLPAGDDRILAELDDHVSGRDVPVAVLTTIKFHRRSRDGLAERYNARTSRAKASVPAGIEPWPIQGAGETMFWLSQHRALVPGDRLIEAASRGLRLCPESWLRYLPSGITIADLAERVRPLLDLPIESVLVSHGEPVMTGGRDALARALASA